MPAIKLRKIGGSVTAAIPPHVLEALALGAGSEVEVTVHDGCMVLTPAKRVRPTLAEMLAECDFTIKPTAAEQAEMDAWEYMKPVGREII
jgi:antitoxin ChpS